MAWTHRLCDEAYSGGQQDSLPLSRTIRGREADREITETASRGLPDTGGPTWDLAAARIALEAIGLRVHRAQEHFPITRYADVGALVWYLKAIPWQIPDSSVVRYADPSLRLHRLVGQTGSPIDIGFHLFVLVAQR